MNYIYDIYLNFNENLYDFFEWNKNDKIVHIKKMPILKIDKDSFKNIVLNKFKIEDCKLLELFSKTELWNVKDKIIYCTAFTDGYDLISVEFDSKGNSIKKSHFFIDDELEVLENNYKLRETKVKFIIKCKEKLLFKTRKQIKDEKFIEKELKNINNDLLNYIYFECFGKKEKNKSIILKKIKSVSKNSKIYENLYNILKLTSSSKK